jgi:hypothetical protein
MSNPLLTALSGVISDRIRTADMVVTYIRTANPPPTRAAVMAAEVTWGCPACRHASNVDVKCRGLDET